jgi:hypothetical protein
VPLFRTRGFREFPSRQTVSVGRKGWLAAMLVVAFSVTSMAQQAVSQPPPSKNGGQASNNITDKSSNAPPAPTGTALDPSAIPVIKTLSQVPSSFDRTKSVDLLAAGNANGVAPLLASLAGDPQVQAATAVLTSGKKNDTKAPHLLIHYIVPGTYQAKDTALQGTKDYWYIWRQGIGADEFKGTRLYGVKDLYILSVVGPINDAVTLAAVQKVQYYAVVKKKLPANWQDIFGFLQIAGYATGFFAEAEVKDQFLYGFGKLQDMAVPANITVAGYLPVTATPTYSVVGNTAALLNEGLHIWDAGVGVPVTKVKDLQYNQTSAGLQPAQVDKSAIFGLVNLYFHPLDLQNPGNSWHPSLTGGFALQGEVRDRLLVGITTNLPPIHGLRFTKSSWYQLLQPYVGVEFLSTQRPVTDPTPGASELELHTVRKLAIGLEIPVKTAIQRLNSSQKTTSKNQTQTTTPASSTSQNQ